MKLVVKIFAWTALVLLSVGIALAQASHVVTYEGDANANSKRPNFKGTLIAVDFPGQTATETTSLFRHLGARRFNVGTNPCIVGETVVCVRITVGEPIQSSGSGMISGYSGHGGYSTGGSFSGQLYPITLTVFLVVYDPNDGGNRPTILLGQATELAPAGSGSSFSSSYGSHGGGMYNTSDSNDLSATIGVAVEHDLNALLLRGSFKNVVKKFCALGTEAQWIPGANETVKKYFAQ